MTRVRIWLGLFVFVSGCAASPANDADESTGESASELTQEVARIHVGRPPPPVPPIGRTTDALGSDAARITMPRLPPEPPPIGAPSR